ncbi:MAG: hypothetical protein KGQ49_06190 [Verrucomicrobia bacterium]|nr:hypothetical protein [Verrucomicrobiota bacterium]
MAGVARLMIPSIPSTDEGLKQYLTKLGNEQCQAIEGCIVAAKFDVERLDQAAQKSLRELWEGLRTQLGEIGQTISGFSPDRREQYKALNERVQNLTRYLQTSPAPANLSGTLPAQQGTQQSDLIVAQTNPHTNPVKPAQYTFCAAAFLEQALQRQPFDTRCITHSILKGVAVHQQASGRRPDTNPTILQVLTCGWLNLQLAARPIFGGRPQSADTQQTFYQDLLNRFAVGEAAILTKAPPTSAVYKSDVIEAPLTVAVYRFKDGYVVFNPHGSPEIGNRAYIKIFPSAEKLSQYLSTAFKFLDFPDYPNDDINPETGRDNPNMVEMTWVTLKESQGTQPSALALPAPAQANPRPAPAQAQADRAYLPMAVAGLALSGLGLLYILWRNGLGAASIRLSTENPEL